MLYRGLNCCTEGMAPPFERQLQDEAVWKLHSP